MNTKLITALRTAATAIESGTFSYTWNDPTRCNCGILACSLLGKSPRELNRIAGEMPKNDRGEMTWTHFSAMVCPITGIPEHELFKTLFQSGLTQADFHALEYLTDPKIRSRMKMQTIKGRNPSLVEWLLGKRQVPDSKEAINFRNGFHVALYMRAWADILTEQGADDAPQEQRTELEEAHHER